MSHDAAAVMTLPNTLKDAANAKWLYASAWLAKPEDSMRYGNCNFVEAPPLLLDASLPPIPVRIDLATLTFTRSRQMSYAWERFAHEDSGEWRLRITGINIDRSTGDSSRVDMGWFDFLARYTADTQQFTFEDEQREAGMSDESSDDDDEEEEEEAEEEEEHKRRVSR